MWLYGGTCGLLWSIGNFFSIIAVDYLGEGVGYSATQTAMLGKYSVLESESGFLTRTLYHADFRHLLYPLCLKSSEWLVGNLLL